MQTKGKIIITLGMILLVGILIRFHSLSTYLFYPDSYVQLILAKNIQTYGGVIGQLGPKGMVYPDFFGWTRPIFPTLILFLNFILRDIILSARIISFLVGVVSIPLAYVLGSRALNSKITGVFASLLLATSYNHAIWGGFILSDTTGVFFLLLFLAELFLVIKRKSEISNIREIILGIIFALTILSRYEYTLLLLPIIYLLYSTAENFKQFFVRLLNILAGSAITFAIFYFWLSPFSIESEGVNQVTSLFSSLGNINLTALKLFVLTDPVLVFMFALGTLWILIKKETRKENSPVLIFSFFSIILLGLIYYQINPEMQRYYIHLIPFLLLPASFAGNKLIYSISKSPARFYSGVLVLLLAFVFQGYISYKGLHQKDDGIWFTHGYEELSAKALNSEINSTNDTIAIVSYPEPYFMFTNYSIQSIIPDYPFVFISDSYDNESIYIVEDEGMRRIFPKFSEFLQTNLAPNKISEFKENAQFRSGGDIYPVSEPVNIYRITLKDLKSKIEENEAYNSNPLF